MSSKSIKWMVRALMVHLLIMSLFRISLATANLLELVCKMKISGLRKHFFFFDLLCCTSYNVSVQFSHCHVRLFATPWTTAHQASLSINNSQSSPKFMSIESVMPSNHLILCHPLLLQLQSFPASGSFQMNQLFLSGGQSIGVSDSTLALPVNTKDWSPLGWTGWISLQSKGFSRVFSNTTVQRHQFVSAQLSL